MAPILLALMLSLGSSAPQQTNDLRITIAPVESADVKPGNPEFVLTLQNEGDADLVVTLGAVIGRKLYPHAITLLLTNQSGRTSTLRFRGPVRVGGRMDPFIVGMPSGATYALRVSLGQFTSAYTGVGRTTSNELEPMVPPGSYTIQATLHAPAGNTSDVYGNPLMNLWTGEAASAVLRFSVP
jgi:hypothetical protein